MKEVRARITDDLLDVIEAMRGGQPRSQFLAGAIRRGVLAIHEEAMRNTMLGHSGASLGLAPLKNEGQYHYFDRESVERIGKLIDRLAR